MRYAKAPKSDRCSICLNFYKRDDIIVQINCRHDFCPAYILDWYKRNDSCPLCRKPICKLKKNVEDAVFFVYASDNKTVYSGVLSILYPSIFISSENGLPLMNILSILLTL